MKNKFSIFIVVMAILTISFIGWYLYYISSIPNGKREEAETTE
jgi:hypothetical protein